MTINEPDSFGADDVEGAPVGVSCPDCGGTLWADGEGVRCRIGHRFSDDAGLLVAQNDALRRLLWAAQRALEEKAVVLRRAARRSGDSFSGRSFARRAAEAAEQADQLRALVEPATSDRAPSD